MNVYRAIEELIAYSVSNGLIESVDVTWARTGLFEKLELPGSKDEFNGS